MVPYCYIHHQIKNDTIQKNVCFDIMDVSINFTLHMKKFPSWLFATSLGKETDWDTGWSIFPSCWILFCRHVKGMAHKNKIQLFQDLLQMNERKAEDLQFQLHSNSSYFGHWISLLKLTKKFISSTPLSSLFSQASVPT